MSLVLLTPLTKPRSEAAPLTSLPNLADTAAWWKIRHLPNWTFLFSFILQRFEAEGEMMVLSGCGNPIMAHSCTISHCE